VRITAGIARERGKPLDLAEIELDDPRDDEILVRMVATGICHTDAKARDQLVPVRLPMILGHEGAGVVERVGSTVTRVAPGDEVLLTPDSCGRCPRCLRGQPTYCDHNVTLTFGGTRADGSPRAHDGDTAVRAAFFGQSSFATHALATERNVVVVPQGSDLALLAALGCGVQTGAGALLNAMPIGPGATVAVFGAGAVGMSALMAAAASGAGEIVVVDRDQGRLALAVELGATHVVDTTTGVDVGTEVRKRSGGGVDVAFDTTGAPELLVTAVESLTARGVCGFVAGSEKQLTLPLKTLMYRGRSLRGIMGGDGAAQLLLPRLIAMYERGSFPFHRLVRHYPFAQLNDAMADAESGAAIKPVLTFDS
jgi:aryl-alcohol dehydrogenase